MTEIKDLSPENIDYKKTALSKTVSKLVEFTQNNSETLKNQAIICTLDQLKAEEAIRVAEYKNKTTPSSATTVLLENATRQKKNADTHAETLRLSHGHSPEDLGRFDEITQQTLSTYTQVSELGFNASDLHQKIIEFIPNLNRII